MATANAPENVSERLTTSTATGDNRPHHRPSLNRSRYRKTWSPVSPRRPTPRPAWFSHLDISREEFDTHAHVDERDGRVHITVNKLRNVPLSSFLSMPDEADIAAAVARSNGVLGDEMQNAPPKLNIVIMVIGSRGDVQPFVAIAKVLKRWGHRVRVATHGAFREFVEGEGIELFDVGGDPAELMAFMVRNPGLMPSLETIRTGDVVRRREQMFAMFQGFWRACVELDDGSKNHRKKEDTDTSDNLASANSATKPDDDNDLEPFIADAIIANPPSFAHVHCAQKLGIPLHMMFTFPYSPTQTIAHPLANIQGTNVKSEYANAISYPMVDIMCWQGLGDLVNRFREKTLGLEPVATLWAPGMISRLKVPFTYLWSPGLIPKPYDWGDHIDITGFVFLDLSPNFTPPPDLLDFLSAGPPPIYIGFGSIVVDDPDRLTKSIFQAVQETGVRALVSKGWGDIGREYNNVPEKVFILGNIPHDWLYSKVSAVIHHGGAGTTAIGLYHGRPTMIVPFFGDQPFWGAMIANASAGPEPVPHKELTAEKLAEGIRKLLSAECRSAASEIQRRIREEDGDGAENAVRSFYKALDQLKRGKRGLGESGRRWGEGGPGGPAEGKWGLGGPGMRCAILEEKVAVWRIRKTRVKLSALAAYYLVKEGKLAWKDLRLVRHTEWNDYDGPGEPISGGASALFGSVTSVARGIFGVPYSWYKKARKIDGEMLDAFDIPTSKECYRRRTSSRHQLKSESPTPIQPPESTSHENPHDQPPPSTTATSSSSKSPKGPETLQDLGKSLACTTGKGFAHAAKAGVRAPVDISLAVAKGFHNAPRLVGDDVRRPNRITGFQSGLRAAGKEFALGVYDGVTGVVVKPYRGAKNAGFTGFCKGLGKGVVGGFLKTNAAVAGVVGFSLKGLHREIRKERDEAALRRIRDARVEQGRREFMVGKLEALDRVLSGWEVIEKERKWWKWREDELGREISGVRVGCGKRCWKRLRGREETE